MRITQSMLTQNNLRYISKNYERMGSIQDQLVTGKKITRPSDDPVVAMKGMRYRSQVVEVEQFKRNIGEGFSWMENGDAALDETGQVLHRIRELTVQASNDSYDESARKNISKEITRLQEHLVALAETKVGDKYIFNGTNTDASPVDATKMNVDFEGFKTKLATPSNAENYSITYKGRTYKYDSDNGSDEFKFKYNDNESITINITNSKVEHSIFEKRKLMPEEPAVETITEIADSDLVISHNESVSFNNQDVEIEVLKGVTIPINIRSQNAFSINMFSGIESIKKMLTNPDVESADISTAIDEIDRFMDDVVSTRAELGARTNRAEMVENRLLKQEVIAKQTVSENEDIDFEKAIIDLKTQESIHRASLAAGARIIQPTLMDFLR
ncbi:flagellar hook-associated protein FlgL [Bacillus tianshenii]|nr:flagellar hook-associated protein FlgL [Bacillus tianshenii]